MPSPRLNEEEFLHMCYKRKGDLSNQQYTVYEDINIQGEFKFGLMLGHGRFEKAFKVTHGAYIRSLDFQDAIFKVSPEISEKADIATIYNDRNYFSEFSDDELHQAGLLIPTSRLHHN